MHRKTVHRWMAALALVAALGVMGARPAAAAELSGTTLADQFAGLWSAVSAAPAALWDSLIGWFGGGDTPSLQKQKEDEGWGIDPLGDPSESSTSAVAGSR
jgi:hypothetical protein